ncbi:acyl-ACP--UDP-N-acetylglucosamine O-acyltransferase [Streptomyces sp. BE147]|uniref:acyl-ACP--UDP-N-acetylglucosamine O-acyltransferase n=1 Tax=Streptomyces sp. BE147 TaxID=3002524 RepID=UPI002E7915DE|nr:acyl-ACP--UDP-N-acetylglucosamine O-acyltransferase [Streptomyces sp. BE147]MEE1736162.1 acyl-ACP--UDP-N-acetylglucosamine O-acyltransferase [Streptomyces sp. BE147]
MIHPSAVVHPDALIHPGAVVGPMCNVAAGVRIGRGTRLISHVWVEERTVLGEDNVVFPFAGLGGPPQTRAPAGTVQAPLVIGDRNQIRESATIHRGSTASGGTRVGDDCLVMTCAHIAHDCVVGNGVVVTSGTAIAGHCRVDDFVNISAMVNVTQHRHIGTHAFIASMAKVDRDIPPYTIAQGNDILRIRGINLVGLRRRSFPPQTLRHLVGTVRTWTTRTDLSRPQRLEQMTADHGHIPEASALITFLATRSTPVPTARMPTHAPPPPHEVVKPRL